MRHVSAFHHLLFWLYMTAMFLLSFGMLFVLFGRMS